MSFSDLIFGKSKSAGPSKQSVEEKALLNTLMNLYYSKDSTGKRTDKPATTGMVSEYANAMKKILSQSGVPINYNGKQIGSVKPLKSMTTEATLQQQLLQNQMQPIIDLFKQMYAARFGTSPSSYQSGLMEKLAPSLIQSGATKGLGDAAMAVGSAMMTGGLPIY
jgi:hypothetical protein